jgi:hypothetical protein
MIFPIVIPAKAGIHRPAPGVVEGWIPAFAFAGMTDFIGVVQ